MKQQSVSYSPFLVITLVIIALVLRLPLLNGSFWLDEAAQALESARPLSEQFNIAYDFQPPLMHLLVHFALYISRSEWWLRTVGALIPGLISIWATYRIGVRLFSPKIAWWSSLLLATNSFHIFYSQELRPYALPTMFACLSWLILLNWPKVPLKKSFFARYSLVSPFSLYALVTVLGLYSSYLYPFLIISQALYVLLLKKEHFQSYAYQALFWILGFLPWLPSFMAQFAVGGELRQQLPGWDKVVSIDAVRSLALVLGKFMFGVLDLRFSLFFVAGALVMLIITGFGMATLFFPKHSFLKVLQKIKPTQQSKITHDISVVFIWLVIPLITAWLISFVVPVLHPKRVLFLLPAFYLLLVASLENFPHRKVSHLLLGILLLINGYSTLSYYTQPRLQRENWRDLHTLITHLYPEKSVALFSFPEPFAPWIWYDSNKYPVQATGTLAAADANIEQAVDEIDDYTYILVFDYLRTLTDPDNILLNEVKNHGYKEMDFFDQTNIGFVRIYAQPQQQALVVE
jgi:mannosyltransferase